MIISESKKENYCTEISNELAVIYSDTTEEKGGKGQYFRPHDLLCASLASCLNISTRMSLEQENIKFEKVIVKVDLDRRDENKIKFLYDIEIIGDISNETKQLIINTVKHCPVKRTLSKEIEFEFMEIK